MRLDLSFLGWIHSLACVVALALGGINLARPKGTRRHRAIGQAYLWAMLVVGVTSLAIYGQGRFFFPHWLAVASLALTGLAYAFAHFRRPAGLWLHGHVTSTVLTYYLLIGGGINEAFLRVDVLCRLSGGFPSPLIGATHMAVLALTAIALVWLNVKYAPWRLWRRGPGSADRQTDATNVSRATHA
jgi:uncharacterized membrane protein